MRRLGLAHPTEGTQSARSTTTTTPGSTAGARRGRGTPGEGRLRLVSVADNISWHVAAPLLAAIAASIHTTVGTVTYAVSAYTMGYGLALPFWARVVERRGLRVVSVGLVIAALGGVASAMATVPGAWVAARAVSGLGCAVVNPVIAMFYEAVADARRRQRGFATMMAVTSVSSMVTPLAVGAAASEGQWRSALAAGGVMLLVAACVGQGLPSLVPPRDGVGVDGTNASAGRPWRVRGLFAHPRRRPAHAQRSAAASGTRPRSRAATASRPAAHAARTRATVGVLPGPRRRSFTDRRPPPLAVLPRQRRHSLHAGPPSGWSALLPKPRRRSAHARTSGRPRARSPFTLSVLLRLPGFWAVLGLGLAEGVVMLGLPSLFAPALSARGLDRAVSPVMASYGLSVLLGAVLVQRQAKVRSARFLLLAGGHLGVAASLVASLRLHAPTFLVASVLLGLSWSMLHTTLQTWAPLLVPVHARATTVSIFATSALMSSATAVFLAAPLIQLGWQSAVFWGVAVVCLALMIASVALCGRPRDRALGERPAEPEEVRAC